MVEYGEQREEGGPMVYSEGLWVFCGRWDVATYINFHTTEKLST